MIMFDVYDDIKAERRRAHDKHADLSMESHVMPVDSLSRLAILLEEVGEVAQEFNDARGAHRSVDLRNLYAELVQTAAMAAAWADVVSQYL